MKSALQEKIYLPLRAAWAAKNGLPDQAVVDYTATLLRDMDRLPSPRCRKAIILGNTRATAFTVAAALQAGHESFVLLGGKPVGHEHPMFTTYVNNRLTDNQRALSESADQTEAELAEKLLLQAGVPQQNIQRFSNDSSTNTGANMRLLKQSLFSDNHPQALEFYTLAGSARRALMTARKEFGDGPVISAHNAYPTGVTPENWSTEPVACAHMAGEAVKSLGQPALYVRRGYAADINLSAEAIRTGRYLRSFGQMRPGAPA